MTLNIFLLAHLFLELYMLNVCFECIYVYVYLLN